MNKSYLKILFTLLLTGFVFYFLFDFFGGEGLRFSFLNFNWLFGALVLISYGFSLALKALRFRFFLRGAVSFREIYAITAIHSFWNNVLPFRTGELSYLYLLRKQGKVSDGANLASLLVARLFDAAVVGFLVIFSASFIFTAQNPLLGNFLKYLLLAAGFLMIVFIALIALFNAKLAEFIKKIPQGKKSIFSFLFKKIAEAIEAMQALRGIRSFSIFLLASLAIWVGDFLFVWTGFKAAGLDLGIAQGLFMTAFPVIAALLPLQSPAGIGTFEGTLLVGLLALGIEGALGLGASLVFHGEFILSSFLAFLIASGFGPRQGGKKEPRTDSDLYASFANPEKDFRNTNFTNLILGMVKGKTLLDIGCGYGQFLYKANKKGFRALGIEPDPVAREIATNCYPGIQIIPKQAEDFAGDHCFDTVTVLDVLEDIREDQNFLKKAANFVCPGGRLIVTAPSYPWLFGSRDRMLNYCRRYNSKKLAKQIEQLGFKIATRRLWNVLGFFPYIFLYKIFKKATHVPQLRGGSPKKGVGKFISFLLFQWFRLVENNFNFRFGLTAIIAADKNTEEPLKPVEFHDKVRPA